MERKRVFLVGFMGSGKTTVGGIVARRLGWEFLDTDEEIEKKEGMSVKDIFSRKGELYFRKLELEVLKEVSGRESVVVATGGGLGANRDAMELMRKSGLVVWLKVSFGEFLRRCSSCSDRPLLKEGENKLRELMKEREKVYALAHLKVREGPPEEQAEEILKAISPP